MTLLLQYRTGTSLLLAFKRYYSVAVLFRWYIYFLIHNQTSRQVILAVEDRAVVNDKLQKLSSLVGLLSFPPQSQIKRNNYYIVYVVLSISCNGVVYAVQYYVCHTLSYEALCEAIDLMSAMSAHLCQIMGLPVIEFSKAVDETGISAENSNVEPDGNKTPSQSNSLLGTNHAVDGL